MTRPPAGKDGLGEPKGRSAGPANKTTGAGPKACAARPANGSGPLATARRTRWPEQTQRVRPAHICGHARHASGPGPSATAWRTRRPEQDRQARHLRAHATGEQSTPVQRPHGGRDDQSRTNSPTCGTARPAGSPGPSATARRMRRRAGPTGLHLRAHATGERSEPVSDRTVDEVSGGEPACLTSPSAARTTGEQAGPASDRTADETNERTREPDRPGPHLRARAGRVRR